MKMPVATFVHTSITTRALQKAATRWKMYEYKFGVIKQRIKSGGVKHSVTKRISNKDILLFGLGDSHPIPNIY